MILVDRCKLQTKHGSHLWRNVSKCETNGSKLPERTSHELFSCSKLCLHVDTQWGVLKKIHGGNMESPPEWLSHFENVVEAKLFCVDEIQQAKTQRRYTFETWRRLFTGKRCPPIPMSQKIMQDLSDPASCDSIWLDSEDREPVFGWQPAGPPHRSQIVVRVGWCTLQFDGGEQFLFVGFGLHLKKPRFKSVTCNP